VLAAAYRGVIARPLVGAVPSVASWRLAGLPRALESDQVQRLLGSCDRRTSSGHRDFAILTVLVRLGLRAGELAELQLDDMDWRAGEIVVRGKGRRTERLPLPRDVGEAIVAYLRHGRPDTALDRAVFVRVKAPHRGLTTGGVTQVVVSAGRRAGLGQIHAHRLRHTAATEMLRAGAPLSEIGQVLRHRAALTTPAAPPLPARSTPTATTAPTATAARAIQSHLGVPDPPLPGGAGLAPRTV